MDIQPTDHMLHLSFSDEAHGRADVFCGHFNKRQVANKTFKEIDYSTIKLPFKDKTFDLVYATNILAYAHQPIKMFEEIKRIGKRAHIKERSEFAEMIFGWQETKWIIDVENNELIIKSKNPQKIGRFEALFHNLYATDPTFFDYASKNPGIMNVSVDWNEEDDITEEIEIEEEEFYVPVSEEEKKEEKKEENLENKKEEKSEFEDTNISQAHTRKVKKKKKITKTIFRPCQTEYFDDYREVLGKISEKIDVRNLKNKNLS